MMAGYRLGCPPSVQGHPAPVGRIKDNVYVYER